MVKLFYALLLVMIFIISCNGQVKTPAQEILNNTKTNPNGEGRIIKTQGTNQYAVLGRGIQDKSGNLWFATTGEGVYRFDGKTFTNYLEKDGLSNNYVWSILEDKSGNLWFGTANGICRYDPSGLPGDSVIFKRIPIDPTNFRNFVTYNSVNPNPTEDNSVWSIIQDKKGKLWFGTTKGIYIYDGKSFTHFLHDGVVENNTGAEINKVEALLEDRFGNIWFGGRTTDGLFKFDGKELTNLNPDNKNWLRPVYEDKAGNIWFSNRTRSVYKYDGKNFITFGAGELKGWVNSIVEDASGNYWFSCEGGLYKYDGIHISGFTTKDGLINNDVFCLLIDRSKKLWIGGRGMSLCSYDGKSFTDYTDNSEKNIQKVFEDKKGKYWFGINGGGVCKYDALGSKGTGKSLNYFTAKEGLASTNVKCIAEDKSGNLWFGTNEGVSKFDGKHFTNYTVKEGLSSNDIISLLIDSKGTIWVGTHEGVCRLNSLAKPKDPKLFTSFHIPPAIQEDFSRSITGIKIIWDIKEDKAGNIWFATNGGGAYKYDGRTLSNISEKDGLCSNYVNCILEDKKGNFWFATQHHGICRYEPKNTKFTTFTEDDGLKSREFWTFYEDKEGYIWVPDKGEGIKRFNGKSFENFTGKEGLTKNHVQSIFEDSKGIIWLGCNGGICRFNGKSFENITRKWVLGEL